jgi:hypothetical protein
VAQYAGRPTATAPPWITLATTSPASMPVAVGRIEEDDVGGVARRETADPVRSPEDVRAVDGRGCQRFGRGKLQLGRGEREHERQALAVRAPGVEVRCERDRRAGIDERASRRHRPAQKEGAGRQ